MLKDLSKIETHQEFRELMDTLNRQIESKQDNSAQTTSVQLDDESDRERQEEAGSPRVELDILWAFINADKMKKEFWNRLESRLLDIYQGHPGIRYILTSCDRHKFNFTCFLKQEELEKEESPGLKRSVTDVKGLIQQSRSKHERRVDLKLPALLESESVELILYHTDRDINKDDFNSDLELGRSIKKQMELEKVITDCKGLPYLLLQVAALLKDHKLWRIVVEKQSDYLKGTHAHHKAKRKEMVVNVLRDREILRSGSKMPLIAEEESNNTSGHKSKDRSKEKLSRVSKN